MTFEVAKDGDGEMQNAIVSKKDQDFRLPQTRGTLFGLRVQEIRTNEAEACK